MSDIERDPATKTEDLYQRHEQDDSEWETAEAVTDRPNDLVEGQVHNSTLAERAAAAKKATAKEVKAEAVEDKVVTSAATKAKRTRKST